VTANDLGDPDTGPNNPQNHPILTSALSDGVTLTVGGMFNSMPATTYRLEFFNNSVCDPSGFGEGQTFLGSSTQAADASGDAAISVPIGAPAGGGFITATATDPSGNTSEFSNCIAVVGPASPTPTPTSSATSTRTFTCTSTPTVTADPSIAGTRTPTPTLTHIPTLSPTATGGASPSPTGTQTAPGPTMTSTPTPTPTPMASGMPTMTPTLAPLPCVGDCNHDHAVTVDELLTMVNVALGSADVSTCVSGDANHDAMITIDEILAAVGYALAACPA